MNTKVFNTFSCLTPHPQYMNNLKFVLNAYKLNKANNDIWMNL